MASLGIRLTHSKPRQPAGRGKIERFFRTVREQFLVELAVPGALDAVEDLTRMNDLFAGWVEKVYHPRVHSETGQAPLARFLAAGPPVLPTTAALREAFMWSAQRMVTKTSTFSLHGNIYEVDAALVGRRIEVVFDPFDLTNLDVRFQGRPMGTAIAHTISRHVHPGARPETTPAPPPVATGIDYLGLIADQHHQDLAARINYNDLPTGNQGDNDDNDGDDGDEGHEASDGPFEVNAARNAAQDAALDAELAGFAALGRDLAAGALPGQLDLADLTGFPRFTPEPTPDNPNNPADYDYPEDDEDPR
ncbi:Mu transposase C-terminal domain-containing protein [Pengzhenrongella sp.]|uniref:Mu transposase C-terminal domain-containing protein n=1 Tax=Pengzhenrongella sp. TaxID=2888820 RepID=UPI002F93218B